MNTETEFKKHKTVFHDCYIGYCFLPNERGKVGYAAIKENLPNGQYKIWPWIDGDGYEMISLPDKPLEKIERAEFNRYFSYVLKNAIRYGSNDTLSNKNIAELAEAFLSDFKDPELYCNFKFSEHNNEWKSEKVNPVTGHDYSSQYFICGIDKDRIGFWLSIENE